MILKTEQRCKLFVEAVHVTSEQFLECEELFFMFPRTDLSLGLAEEFMSGKGNKVSYAVRAEVKMALLKLHALNLTESSFPTIGKF